MGGETSLLVLKASDSLGNSGGKAEKLAMLCLKIRYRGTLGSKNVFSSASDYAAGKSDAEWKYLMQMGVTGLETMPVALFADDSIAIDLSRPRTSNLTLGSN
jgi:hypothetical protein